MKSIHFFISVFVLNCIFSINIVSGDSKKQASIQNLKKIESQVISNENQDFFDAHRVTPLSPKKNNKDHSVTPLDHGTTPIKENSDLQSDKENANPVNELARTESMSLRYSYSNNTFASCNSFADLYALAVANATPSSPVKNGSLKGRASLFPAHCNTSGNI